MCIVVASGWRRRSVSLIVAAALLGPLAACGDDETADSDAASASEESVGGEVTAENPEQVADVDGDVEQDVDEVLEEDVVAAEDVADAQDTGEAEGTEDTDDV
ncbi:MAG: hypothetical protein AAGG08_15180, partial [Actinomycetota bacterium]